MVVCNTVGVRHVSVQPQCKLEESLSDWRRFKTIIKGHIWLKATENSISKWIFWMGLGNIEINVVLMLNFNIYDYSQINLTVPGRSTTQCRMYVR